MADESGDTRTDVRADTRVDERAGLAETVRVRLAGRGRPPGTDRLARHRPLLAAAVLFTLVAGVYVTDLLSGSGRAGRGVVVAEVSVGGLPLADAEDTLRASLEPRAARPVRVAVGSGPDAVSGELAQDATGLRVDWPATMARVAVQPLNPFTRIGTVFTDREVQPVARVDRERTTAALEPIAERAGRPPVEAAIRFVRATPTPVEPVEGVRVDLPAAAEAIERSWLARGSAETPVQLPVVPVPAAVSSAELRRAMDTVAVPAVSGPVTVVGEGVRAELTPEAIAAALRFRPDPAGGAGLVPLINMDVAAKAVRDQLAPSERRGRDASVTFAGGAPRVVPGQDGRRIDYPATFAGLTEVLTRTGAGREVTAVYVGEGTAVTVEQLQAALAAGEISTFTTGGFAADSGRNIRRAAELVNGTVVGPGQTFSLNGRTNPRDASNGFVEAGIIRDGAPARGIGGGVSQIATTLYNAGYFAGMTDVEHQEHSYYISRYPMAREATVFNDVIDLKFRNDGPEPVVIRTIWTPTSITAKVLGRKRYEVTSAPGPRSNPTSPKSVSKSGPACKPSKGSAGFTASDTRTLRDLTTGKVRSETRRVVYKASPNVSCGGGRSSRDSDDGDSGDDESD